MSVVHLKTQAGRYEVPELVEGQVLCHNCIRLITEDFNTIADAYDAAATSLNEILRIARPPKKKPDNSLMALADLLLGDLVRDIKENSNAKAAEEADSPNF